MALGAPGQPLHRTRVPAARKTGVRVRASRARARVVKNPTRFSILHNPSGSSSLIIDNQRTWLYEGSPRPRRDVLWVVSIETGAPETGAPEPDAPVKFVVTYHGPVVLRQVTQYRSGVCDIFGSSDDIFVCAKRGTSIEVSLEFGNKAVVDDNAVGDEVDVSWLTSAPIRSYSFRWSV